MAAKSDKQLVFEQALASGALEGHTPTPAFLADVEAVTNGTMTLEQARAQSHKRALDDTAKAPDKLA
ncbi:MAG: antitoxin VbhA family protein [Thiobacillus sp.]